MTKLLRELLCTVSNKTRGLLKKKTFLQFETVRNYSGVSTQTNYQTEAVTDVSQLSP